MKKHTAVFMVISLQMLLVELNPNKPEVAGTQSSKCGADLTVWENVGMKDLATWSDLASGPPFK